MGYKLNKRENILEKKKQETKYRQLCIDKRKPKTASKTKREENQISAKQLLDADASLWSTPVSQSVS